MNIKSAGVLSTSKLYTDAANTHLEMPLSAVLCIQRHMRGILERKHISNTIKRIEEERGEDEAQFVN